jgi:hypothetical protein
VSWAKLDDRANEHRKQLAAGAEACWLWACGLMYANRQPARDGFIPEQMLPMLYPLPPGKRVKLVAKLVEVGLWDIAPGGYLIHQFTVWNRSKEQVEAEREATRNRVAKHRANGVTNQTGNAVTPSVSNAVVPDHSATTPLPAIPDQGTPPPMDLTGGADALPVVVVVPQSGEERIPCPPDLKLTDAQRSQLQIGTGASDYQIDQLELRFRMAASNHDPRPRAAWQSSIGRAVTVEFSNGTRRPPKSPDDPASESDSQTRIRLKGGPRQPNAHDHSTDEKHLAAIGGEIAR